jgi:transposase
MAKHTEEFKYRVVQEYLNGPMGYVALGKKYGLQYSTVRRWVGWYQAHGMEGLTKKFTHYSAEFKLSVLRHVWDNSLSYSQAATHFNIRNPGILAQWVRLYRHGGLGALEPRRKGRPPTMSAPSKKPSPSQEPAEGSHEALLKELNYLRLENAYLKKLQALVQAKEKLARERKRK